ncbi:MAG: hypothetical protein FJ398_24585 [Verrucomicrobia bacterium]|nr:hypothetical protein [Verrucomicrobiota bacterium]
MPLYRVELRCRAAGLQSIRRRSQHRPAIDTGHLALVHGTEATAASHESDGRASLSPASRVGRVPSSSNSRSSLFSVI